MHKKVTISLPPELAERWNKVSEKHTLVKSVMVQNYLLAIIPMLEKKDVHSIINFRIEDNSRDLFNMEHDKSVEEYKKMKLG